jgi:NTE family protein
MLDIEDVFQSETGLSILWGLVWRQNAAEDPRSLSAADVRRTHGLLDTTPLSDFLHQRLEAPDGVLDGIAVNLADGRLQAVAMITTNYATGQTVTWVQGKDFDVWERPDRVSVHAELTVDHVMASTALPLVFPAVKIGDAWYGDGGVRLSAPLAPAVHLGADRIMVVSNQYRRSQAEADRPNVVGYPPTAQIIGIMMNAIFADTLDQDAHTLRRINRLLRDVPKRKRRGLRPVRLLQIRPSVDLGQLAYDYHDQLPASVRFLTSGLGSGDTRSPDWLSVLLFLPEYVDRLMDIGYHDARDRHRDLETFFAGAYDEHEEPAAPGSSAPGSAGMSGDGSLDDGPGRASPSRRGGGEENAVPG